MNCLSTLFIAQETLSVIKEYYPDYGYIVKLQKSKANIVTHPS